MIFTQKKWWMCLSMMCHVFFCVFFFVESKVVEITPIFGNPSCLFLKSKVVLNSKVVEIFLVVRGTS